MWRKLRKIIHHPGTEITTQSFPNFTPDSSRCGLQLEVEFDLITLTYHLHLI